MGMLEVPPMVPHLVPPWFLPWFLPPPRDPNTGRVVTFTNWFPGWPDANYIDKGNYWHVGTCSHLCFALHCSVCLLVHAVWQVWVYKGGETGIITEKSSTPLCFSCRWDSDMTP
jgi:hypothetical protein